MISREKVCTHQVAANAAVDARRDPALSNFLDGLQCRVLEEASLRDKVLALAAVVAEALGGEEGGTESRWRDHGPYPSPEPYNIGILLGKGSFPGTGRRRHRAVLLKYALDALRVCPSALIEVSARVAGGVDHVWNVVWLHGMPFLCDALDFPTELRDAEAFLGELQDTDRLSVLGPFAEPPLGPLAASRPSPLLGASVLGN